MKNTAKISLYILACLLTLKTSKLHAQNIVIPDNQWVMSSFGWFTGETYYHAHKIGEDTILDGTKYHKLYNRGLTPVSPWYALNEYLREDSLNRVFRKIGTDPEKLLFDFSFEIGDMFETSPDCIAMAIEIDSVLIKNGEKRKRIRFEEINNSLFSEDFYWISGVGSNRGLSNFLKFCFPDSDEYLACFSSKGEALYPATSTDCDIFASNVTDPQSEVQSFPNPTQDVFIMKTDMGAFRQYEVFDVLGRRAQTGPLYGNIAEIPLGGLQTGQYYVVASMEDGSKLIRLVSKI
jgi:hypothetical protein